MKQTIDFVDQLNCGQAVKLILKLNWQIVKNLAKGINTFVCRFPWVAIAVILICSVVLSCVNIHRAKSESDRANRAMYLMQQKCDSMDVALSLIKK